MTRRTGLLPSNRRHAPRRLPGLAAPMLAALALAGCERLPLLAFLQPATDASAALPISACVAGRAKPAPSPPKTKGNSRP